MRGGQPRRRFLLTGRSALTPYDRFVAVMRIILPAIAAAIALTALIWPLVSDQPRGFTFNRDALAEHSDKIRVRDARYTGVDAQGRLFHVSAEEAVQDTPSAPTIALRALSAEMALGKGEEARVYAPGGIYLLEEKILDVTGGFELVTCTGYRLATQRAEVDLERHLAQSQQPVEGRSPLGDFQAGGFTLYADDRIARLDNRVRMRIDPVAVEDIAQDMEKSP